MHTDELIALLSAGSPEARGVYLRRVRMVLAGVLIGAVLAVAFTLGLRQDLVALFDDPNRVFKYGFTSVLLFASGLAWWRHGQPGRSARGPLMFIALFCGWLLILSVHSLYVNDFVLLKSEVFSSTAFWCVGVTNLLALAASFAIVRLGQDMAPLDTPTHGYLAALFAISIGVFAYALHCPSDEPLYLATWYGLSIVGFTAIVGPILARKSIW